MHSINIWPVGICFSWSEATRLRRGLLRFFCGFSTVCRFSKSQLVAPSFAHPSSSHICVGGRTRPLWPLACTWNSGDTMWQDVTRCDKTLTRDERLMFATWCMAPCDINRKTRMLSRHDSLWSWKQESKARNVRSVTAAPASQCRPEHSCLSIIIRQKLKWW